MTPLERQDLARSSTHVQIRLLQDLHQSWLESRDLEAIPNPSNESYRIDLRADMLEEGTYKVWRCQRIQRGLLTRPSFRVLQQILPEILVGLLFSKIDSLDVSTA